MAYFRCTTGGSGKGNTLVVTCADDLAGATITCTDGTKTYTKTCPSTAPYEVTFYGLEAGTWTVSATVSGNTYTATAVVVDCTALLGGFNWRAWVDTASQLDSTDYASLSEVLADEEAVRELCLEHACVDYMAGITATNADVETIINTDLFAKWVNNSDYALDYLYANEIIADYMDTADKYFYGEWVITDSTTTPVTWGPKGNVPVMTSNTAPYGEAFSSGSYSTAAAEWAAFDDGLNTAWVSSGVSTSAGEYVGYKFVNPIKAKHIIVYHSSSSTNAHTITYKVQGSNDGFANDIHDLSETITFAFPANSYGNPIFQEAELNTDNYYLSYRLYKLSDTEASRFGFYEIQFYGRELSVSVPVMTSNTTPYGEAFDYDPVDANTYKPYMAFNNDPSNFSDEYTSDGYVGYDFGRKVNIKQVEITPRFTSSHSFVKDFSIKGSNDRTTWVSLYNGTHGNTANKETYAINADTPYRYFAVFAESESYHNNTFAIVALQFYGLDYSEKEFEEGTTKKWLYDHGVEVTELDTTTANWYSAWTKTSVVKNPDSMYFASGTSKSCDISTNSKIDLTNYSYVRGIIDNYVMEDSFVFNIAAANDKTNLSSSVSQGTFATKYYGCLDISSVNQSLYVGGGVNNSSTRKCDLLELWLE